MGPGVPIPGCCSFFTSLRHVSHPPHSMISMPTSPSESRLSIHPWSQRNSDVTGFRNAQAPRENKKSPPSGTHTGFSSPSPTHNRNVHCSVDVLNLWHHHSVDDIGLPCRNLQHLTLIRQSFSRASSLLASYRSHRLSDTFDVMSFLHESPSPPRQRTVRNAKTRSSVPSAPPCTGRNSRHVTSLLWKATPSNRRHSSRRLLRHQLDIWAEFHGCRVEKLRFFLAELNTFIEHASINHNQLRHTSLVIISLRNLFNCLNQSKCDGHAWEMLLASVEQPICRHLHHLRRSNTSLFTLITRIGFSDASRLHCSNNRTNTTIVKVFT